MEYGSERQQGEVGRKVEKDAEQLKREAGQLKREGAQVARGQAESGKEKAAQELDSLSQAVDRAASTLSEEDKEGLANYLHQASEQMSSLSRRLHERSIEQLTEDAKGLARRNPAAFMLGSIALGFGLSRFLKASPPAPQPGASTYQSPQSPPISGSTPGGDIHH